MTRFCTGSCWLVATLLFSLGLSATSFAESRSSARKSDDVTVDLFDAMKSGDIEVRVIPKDASGGKVLIKNVSKKPLAIRLPEAFAAVPVAAQFLPGGNVGGGILGNNLNLGQGNNAGNQALGGGFPGGQNNLMFPGMQGNVGRGGMNNGPFGLPGGGLFRVEPEKVGKLKITSVCLEYGKADPNPHIAYELKPIDSYTSDAQTIEAVKMLVRGEIDQRTAQAVAWHFANGLSWDELANKVAAVHIGGRREPFFSAEHIKRARAIAAEAERRAKAGIESSDNNAPSLAGTK